MSQTSSHLAEMMDMMMKMNEDMSDFAGQDLMSDHAYNQLSMLQKEQVTKIKRMFCHIDTLLKSKAFQKHSASVDAPLRQKRMSEKEKRARAKANPELFHICPCCDSVFMNKFNLKRHRLNTLKCAVIKQSKKGALEFGAHRKPQEINDYIDSHIDDADSDEEIAEQQQLDATEDEQFSIQLYAQDLADGNANDTEILDDMLGDFDANTNIVVNSDEQAGMVDVGTLMEGLSM